MEYPTTKAELMGLVRSARAELEAALAALSDEQIKAPVLGAGWSARDAMWHLAYWEGSMLERLRRAEAGEDLRRPGVTQEQREAEVQAINDQQFAAGRARTLAEVRAEFDRSHQAVLGYFESLSDEQIFGERGLSAGLGFPAVDLMAGDTYEHYAEHRRTIREAHGM